MKEGIRVGSENIHAAELAVMILIRLSDNAYLAFTATPSCLSV